MAKPLSEKERGTLLEVRIRKARIIRNRGVGLPEIADRGPLTVHVFTAEALTDKLRRGEIRAGELESIRAVKSDEYGPSLKKSTPAPSAE